MDEILPEYILSLLFFLIHKAATFEQNQVNNSSSSNVTALPILGVTVSLEEHRLPLTWPWPAQKPA